MYTILYFLCVISIKETISNLCCSSQYIDIKLRINLLHAY